MAESQPSWEIMIAKQPEKALRRLPQDTFQQINQAILALAQNPYPRESRQLVGHDNLYRLTLNGWRLVYAVEDERLIVLILVIAPRQQPERYQLDDETDKPQEFSWVEEIRIAEQKYAFAAFIRQARGEKIRVLIVDNNAASREKLQRLISAEQDMEVMGTATDGEEAIWMTVDLKPDVVLMEIALPGIDGFAISEIMLQQIPTLHIILMSTTYSQPDYPRRSKLAGAKDFLSKATTPRELLDTIRRVHTAREYAAWYIFHTYPGYESKLKQNLLHRIESLGVADKILQVIIPGEAAAESQAERGEQASPGVILIEMILDENTWYALKNTPGITAYYGTEERPNPLQWDQVEEVLNHLVVDPARNIRIPVDIVETIYKLADTQECLLQEYGREPTDREIALEIGLLSGEDIQTIRKSMKNERPLDPTLERRWRRAASKIRRIRRIILEPPPSSEPVAITPRQLFKAQLRDILPSMNEREQKVLEMRFGLVDGQERTLQEVADEFGVTRERIRQIVAKVLSRLRYPLSEGRQEMKVTAQSLRTLKLGKYVEISLSVADLSESLAFYESLGLKKVDEGIEPHPWAVLSDEKLLISLHQQSFPSPVLSYFDWEEISPKINALKTLNVAIDNVQTLGVPLTPRQDNFVLAAEFEAYEGQRVRLIHPWHERTNIGRYMTSRCHRFGELSLKTENVEAAVSYWEQLGFQRIAGDDRPYPWATVTDGLIRLGLHQTSKFAKPTISYFAPDMPDRLKQLRKAGLKFLSERTDAQGQRIGAVVQSPDGQPFFLFTGQVGSLN